MLRMFAEKIDGMSGAEGNENDQREVYKYIRKLTK